MPNTLEQGPGDKMLIGPFTARFCETNDCWITDCGQHLELTIDETTGNIDAQIKRILIHKNDKLNKNLIDFMGPEVFKEHKKMANKMTKKLEETHKEKVIIIIADLD